MHAKFISTSKVTLLCLRNRTEGGLCSTEGMLLVGRGELGSDSAGRDRYYWKSSSARGTWISCSGSP